MTQKIVLTRGLPASGKSGWAEKMLKAFPNDWVRVERDLLRDQLFGNRFYKKPEDWLMTDEEFKTYLTDRENTVSVVQKSMAQAALKAGKSVIVSDTNLVAKYVREWAKFAARNGVELVQIKFDDPSLTLDELITRDAGRENPVGESVIREMWNNKTRNGKIAEVDVSKEMSESLVVEPYDNPTNLPEVVIVDVDGTLAKMADRSPYEWNRVGEDEPVQAVVNAVNDAMRAGATIVVMSGRDGSCYDISNRWLLNALGHNFHLYMRAEGDQRKDDLVKYELFNKHIRNKFHVRYVLDDRDQVVAMWRKLGLACFQVNYGAF